MVLCLTYAYVTKVLCFYVTMSSKPVFSCLTQKPHPVRRPPLCRLPKVKSKDFPRKVYIPL